MNVLASQRLSLPLFALRLRALVLALGESVRPPWWKTEFMNETGFRFLERLYPRTYFRAAVNSSGKAACDVHDRAAGRVGLYHLFRLPESLEADMHHVPPNTDTKFVIEFRSGIGNEKKLMELLASMCTVAHGKDFGLGARRIGTASDLAKPDGFSKTAAFYSEAFEQRKPGFPYFVTE